MPSIPLFHFLPQGSGSSGVRADPSLLDRQFEGGMQLGAGIRATADVMADTAQRVQAAADFRQQTELDSSMRDAWAQYQGQLNPSSDEMKWAESWRKQLDDVARIPLSNAAPHNKPRLQSMLEGFKSQTTYDVTMQAKAAGVQKAKAAAEYRLDQAWKTRDPEGAATILQDMAAHGLIHTEDIPALKQKGMVTMERQQAFAAIQADPVAAHEALSAKTEGGRWQNYKALEEDDRLTLLNHARYQTTARQSAAYSDLIDGLQNNDVKPPEVLQALVDRQVITPQQRRSYETAYRHGSFNTNPTDIGELLSDITAYDPKKDPNLTTRAKLLGRIATSGFPTNVQSEATELLGKKANPKDVLNGPVAKDAFEAIDQRFKLGIYGKYEVRKKDDLAPTGSSIQTVPQAYEKALATKRRIEDVTRRFIEANPQATAEQVNRVIYETGRKEMLRSGVSVILGTIDPLTGKVAGDSQSGKKN